MKYMTYIVLLLSALCPTCTMASTTRPYQVELIVFQRLKSPDTLREWLFAGQSYKIPLTNTRNLVPFSAGDDPPGLYQTLPNDQKTLTNLTKKLSAGNQFKILLHTSWEQSHEQDNEKVHLFALPLIDNDWIPDEQTSTDYNPTLNWTVDGFIQIKQLKHFRTHCELNFTLPHDLTLAFYPELANKLELGDAPYAHFKLKQTRAITAGELVYFDHPLFGVLMKITPVAITRAPAPPQISQVRYDDIPDNPSHTQK